MFNLKAAWRLVFLPVSCVQKFPSTHSLSFSSFEPIANQMLGCSGTKIPQWIQLASIV